MNRWIGVASAAALGLVACSDPAADAPACGAVGWTDPTASLDGLRLTVRAQNSNTVPAPEQFARLAKAAGAPGF